MLRRAAQFGRIVAGCLVSTALAAACAAAQGAPGTEELMRSIGLTKPPFTRAPEFNLRDGHGGLASLSGQRGKLVLLNFWATWCGPCREEMPSMEQLSRFFGGQGFTVLAINQRESAAQVLRFLQAHGLNFRAPLDSDGRVAASYRVFGMPATYLIDAGGQAIGLKSGPRDWAAREVVEVFRKLIADGGGAGGSPALEPAMPMPRLRAKSDAIAVRSQQDSHAEVIGQLAAGEDLTPLGKVSGAGEFWYMVKIKNGAVGWVRGGEVEEVGARK